MQKRVLSFLMVLAMVFSLLPVSLVAAETAAAEPGYVMVLQKAHNQTEGSLAIDIYLQANKPDQAAVTGYQFKVVPAEGLVVTGAVDATGNNGLAGSDNVFIYTPGSAELTVAAARKLVATVTVTGETLPAEVEKAITLSDATVTTAETEFTPTFATVADGCGHDCAHGEGTWKPATAADLTGSKLPAGNYYLVEDVSTSKTITVSDANAKVNICLNGYTLTSSARILNITGKGADVAFCDCTATGTGEELQAGKVLLKYYNWGNFRQTAAETKLTVRNVIIEGAEDAIASSTTDSNIGNAAAFYQGSAATNSVINVENVLMKDINSSKTVNDIRAVGIFKDVTFVNCSGGGNSATDPLAIFATNGNPDKTDNLSLTIDGCKFIDCQGDALDTNGKTKMVFTLKGNVQAENAFYVTDSCKLNLELGTNADVTIRTHSDRTEATLGTNVVIPEGATLTAGTALYANTGSFISYKDGQFSFASHAHDEVSFKAWDDSDSLPIEGNWYLTTDVTLNCARFIVARNTTLNLDLNGHTIRQTKATAGIYSVEGKLNLYDCAEEYDANGNWIGGQITGGDQEFGGAIGIQRGTTGGAEEARPTFNMYGGRLAGNGNGKTSSGGAIYIASSLTATSGKLQWGGLFNMYGGEIYGNTATTLGTAVTVWGFSHTATSGSIGADPALKMGATFNMFGGKIHGNNGTREDKTYLNGTVNLTFDAVFNMSGGEICNNHVERGGAIYLDKAATTVNITGGKIYGNSAVESAGKRALNTKDATYTGRGGAIVAQNGGNVTIKNAEIKDNYSTWGGALAIYGGSTAVLTAENVIFEGNYSVDKRTNEQAKLAYGTNGNGGAIYFTDANTKATIKNCQFIDNKATKDNTGDNDYNGAAGAIYADYIKNLTIDGCTFTGNKCGLESGGALYLRNGAVADVKNSTFTGNEAKIAGSAIYTLGASVLKLTDTVVTDNTVKNNALGAVYVTSTTGRVIASGKVIINGNFNTKTVDGGNGNNQADLVFQGQAARTELMEVDQLGAGSHINLYFNNSSSTVTKNDVASGYVKLSTEEGAKQETWDCGWITVYKGTTDQGRNVSLVNDEFVFGHYHLMPDGTQQEFKAHSATTKPTAAGYYYLSKDITSSAEWTINVDGIHLCFNGKTLTSGVNSAINMKAGAGITLNVYDCTATYENDTYIGGGITGTKRTFGSGLRVEAPSSGKHVVNWYGGAIFNCVSKATGTGSSGGSAIYTASSTAVEINWKNGAVFGNSTNDDDEKATTATAGVIQIMNGKMTIEDGLFYNNIVTDKGTGSDKAYGGVFYNDGILTINGGKFFNNSAEDMGGCIYNTDTLTINAGVVFENNTITQGYGGAIYNANSANIVTITGTADKPVIFKGNAAERKATQTTTDGVTSTTYSLGCGGAIELMNGQNTNISYAHFLDNTAYQGGAIRSGGGSGTTKLTMSNCYFAGNETANNGGALFVNSDDAILSNNLFQENQAGDRGGAIYSTPGTAKINMTGDVLKENYSKNYGGAIYAGNNLTLTMEGVQFIENSTTSWGGAIYSGNSTVVINASNCLFEGNTAKNGGALSLDWAKTMSYTGCTFKNNTATNGGAAYVRGNASAVITFGGAGDLGCTFIGNEAATAGAILCSSDKATNTPTHNLINCSFTENVATSDTAAVKVAGHSKTTLTDCVIQNNTSRIYGALHQATNSCKMNLVGKMIVTDNITTSYASHSKNTDLYIQQYPQNPTETDPLNNSFVDVSGLTAGSKIGVHMADNRGQSDPQFTMNGGAAMKDYFYATSTYFVLTEMEGELALVKYVDEAGNVYTTVQEAVAAAEATGATEFKLQADANGEELTLNTITTIDLNGRDGGTVTVPEGKELTLIDSATNRYENANTPEITVIGDVKEYVEVGSGNSLKRYVVLTSNVDATTGAKTLSAHRVYLAINSKTLRPINNGVGFKAIFAGDEVVAENVTYGIELSGYSDFNQIWKATFDDMEPGALSDTPNQKTIVIYDAISAADTARWDANLYGRPFITINGNTYYGKTVDVNMKEMAQAALNSGDQTVIDAVNAMMTKCGVSAN